MQERGVFVGHSSINRWAIRFLPVLKKVFRKYKRPTGGSWRMDETYIKVNRRPRQSRSQKIGKFVYTQHFQ